MLTPEGPEPAAGSGTLHRESERTEPITADRTMNVKESKVRKPPVDRRKASIYVFIAVGLVIFFLPLMVIIHEVGHAAAVVALGGEVTGYEYNEYGASVKFDGIEDEQDLLIVHISGVLATIIVGAYMLFHVWRFRGHPFQEAVTLIWGLVLLLADVITYTIADLFYDHGGDFEKVYDTYTWTAPAAILFDIVLVLLVMYVMSKEEFWRGIQLPRKSVS